MSDEYSDKPWNEMQEIGAARVIVTAAKYGIYALRLRFKKPDELDTSENIKER